MRVKKVRGAHGHYFEARGNGPVRRIIAEGNTQKDAMAAFAVVAAEQLRQLPTQWKSVG